MKIVIGVPEVMYTACSGGNITPLTNMESCLISYVGDGQPLSEILDKISVEIKDTCTWDDKTLTPTIGAEKVLEIIEKYKGASE